MIHRSLNQSPFNNYFYILHKIPAKNLKNILFYKGRDELFYLEIII